MESVIKVTKQQRKPKSRRLRKTDKSQKSFPFATKTMCLIEPGFPDRYFAGHETVVKNVALGGATLASGILVLLNSLSTSALGVTALRSVYDKYIVHRSRIEVMCSNFLTTQPIRLLVVPIDSNTALSLPTPTDDVLCELKYAKNFLLSIMGGGKDVTKLTADVMTSSLTGLNTVAQVGSLIGNTGSANSTAAFTDPASKFQWYVSISSISNTNTGVDAAWVSYRLYQEVEYFDRLPEGY